MPDRHRSLATFRTGSFRSRGHRLAYSEYGAGTRPLVLIPALLLSREMHDPVARHLAAQGNRVITLDPLGQGTSSRPRDACEYSIRHFAQDTVALLDHLEIPQAVVGGTSLGANITLEVAAIAPRRVRGMVLEMPALDHALVSTTIAFGPLMVALTLAEPAMRILARGLRLLPRWPVPMIGNVLLDALRQDPAPSAALLQGLIFGHLAPHRSERRELNMPALVIGHHRDPIHPFSDADMLVGELPDARLIEASTILEMRTRPDRLYQEVVEFLDDCWRPLARARAPRRGAANPAAPRASAVRRA